jgi:hypothetical protein
MKRPLLTKSSGQVQTAKKPKIFAAQVQNPPSTLSNGKFFTFKKDKATYVKGLQVDPESGSKKHLPSWNEGITASAAVLAASQVSVDASNWAPTLHRDFVMAIFDIGLQKSSPAVLLQEMIQKPSQMNGDRMKSKLQKFRQNADNERQKFLDEYDDYLKHNTFQTLTNGPLFGGHAVGMLSNSVINGRDNTNGGNGCNERFETQEGFVQRPCSIDADASILDLALTSKEMASDLGLAFENVRRKIELMSSQLRKEPKTPESSKSISYKSDGTTRASLVDSFVDPVDLSIILHSHYINLFNLGKGLETVASGQETSVSSHFVTKCAPLSRENVEPESTFESTEFLLEGFSCTSGHVACSDLMSLPAGDEYHSPGFSPSTDIVYTFKKEDELSHIPVSPSASSEQDELMESSKLHPVAAVALCSDHFSFRDIGQRGDKNAGLGTVPMQDELSYLHSSWEYTVNASGDI